MTSKRNLLSRILVLLLLLLMGAQAEIVDRTIAVVNEHLVTWSDLDEQMRFEALENERALKDLGEADRHTAFEHLVEYRILRDQMQGLPTATAAEVDARISDLRGEWHMAKDDAEWAATLKSYGLSAEELQELVMNQIEILRFMESRVRPLVRVSRREVEDYYTSTLAPQVMAQGQRAETVESMTPKIRELLVEQKMNIEMEKWLENLRAQSRVQILWEGAN
jgi:peptidyl-prolyl cis-trans isomerase SurA